MCLQTELAIEDNFLGTAVAAFGFDNALGHQKHAPDALSAHHMPKFSRVWPGKKGEMQNVTWTLPNGQPQDFHFPDSHPDMPGWFKGMKLIIEE